MINFKKKLGDYDYRLPTELIANKPASPRDKSRLLVYKRKDRKVFWDYFLDMPRYLPEKAVLVFNETRVLPARFIVRKENGGVARILYVGRRRNGFLEFLSDKNIPSGERLSVGRRPLFEVVKKEKGLYLMRPLFPADQLEKIMMKKGITPIPPYIKNTPLSEKELREKYQSVFAKINGSVAAPTASLHFTKRLLAKLEKAGFAAKFIVLHVGLGTFAPLREENLVCHKLHREYYEIDPVAARFLNQAKKEKRPVIAVGTTVARSLESAANRKGVLTNLFGETALFIAEGYKFKFVDGLITNFHTPKSSLLMLVSALISRKTALQLYKKAIKEKFRFFSFGDGMLII